MKSWTSICVALLTLVAMAVAAVPITWGSNEGLQTMFNAPIQWIPRGYTARKEYDRFLDQFRSHEMILVSWPGCTVDDHRLEQAADALLAVRDERAAAGKPALFNQVVNGYTILQTLMDAPAQLSRSQAIRRIQGALVGADGETSCLIVFVTEQGSMGRRETLAVIVDTLQRAGYDRQDLRLAGSPIDGIGTDDESIRSLQYYSLPAILISLVLCCLCLRSMWLTLPILAVGALGQAAMLAIVWFLGITMNAILIVLPALVFVLTVSAGVHLVNYFYDELHRGSAAGATRRALLKAWGPCTLAAVTTAIGLASLMVSEVWPVRQFGALAACGVLLTVVLLFLLLPGAMDVRLRFGTKTVKAARQTASPAGSRRFDFWTVAATIIWKFGGWISLGCVSLLLACGVGLVWLRSSINVVSLLAPENRVVQDFHWFEEHIGPLVPVEVVVHFDDSCTLDGLQRMELVRSAHSEIGKIENLDGALSAASFSPPIPKPGGMRRTIRRAVIRRLIEEHEDELISAQYLHLKKGRESWRISARVLGQDDFDYGRFLDRLQERVSPVIAHYENSGYRGITASYTGVTSVVYDVEKMLLADLFDSFLTALVFVTIVMTVALRSIRASLVAMIPNVFPTVVLFGTMGWMGRTVDIGTVMTASVALGIAVDGTFHFLKWFRQELDLGKPRRKAVAYAYQHCGRALTQTTVICALGLLVFGLSGFLPVRHFAVTLFLLLIAALVGDLVVLPALLVSPLGAFFARRRSSGIAGEHSASETDEATCTA